MPLHSVTQYLSSSDGVLVSFIFPSLAAAAAAVVVVFIGFFLASQACSVGIKKKAFPFVGDTVQRGFVSLREFHWPKQRR